MTKLRVVVFKTNLNVPVSVYTFVIIIVSFISISLSLYTVNIIRKRTLRVMGTHECERSNEK